MVYDLIIVGGGPGGYTAALYGVRAGLRVLVLERSAAGGQMALTHWIDNYPGFEEGIDGFSLAQNMRKHAERFGAGTVYEEVIALTLETNPKLVQTAQHCYLAKSVIFATGADPRKLGLPEEQELTGRGVSYCAACDGMFYRDKRVIVVGGGNSAVADALLLSRVAKQVTLVHRRDRLRATPIYNRALEQAKNIQIYWNYRVSKILSDGMVSGVELTHVTTNKPIQLPCDGIFVSIGRQPVTALVAEQLPLDSSGYVIAGEDTCTPIPGVYAVGDVRTKQLRQIVTAVADGATAVHEAEMYLEILDATELQ